MSHTTLNHLSRLSLVLVFVLSACTQKTQQPPTAESSPTVPAYVTPSLPVPSKAPEPSRAPGRPLVLDVSPAPGEELLSDQPIVMTFDQSMNQDTVKDSIALCSTDGSCGTAPKLAWRSASVLELSQPTGWPTDTQFVINLGDTAESSGGKTLARAQQFTINTLGKLAVAQIIPADGANDITADAMVTVVFNRPVVPLTAISNQGSLPIPVTFSPAVVGIGEWLNTSIYVFRPSQPLAAGVKYQGSVNAGLKDITGATLERSQTFSFSVSPPMVKRAGFANNTAVGLDQPISVTFSQNMDHASVEAAFKISPAIPGNFVWATEQADPDTTSNTSTKGDPAQANAVSIVWGETLGFQPTSLLPRNTNFVVSISSAAKARTGTAGLNQPLSFNFRTLALPSVLDTRPKNGDANAPADNGFEIQFNVPISEASVYQNIIFSPAISASQIFSYYSPYDNRFSFNTPLQPSTRYSITIGPGVRDQFGARLSAPKVISFTTAKLAPFAQLQTNGDVGTYDASRPLKVFAAYRNVSRINATLLRLPADAIEFLRTRDLQKIYNEVSRSTPGFTQTILVSNTLNQTNFSAIKLAEKDDTPSLPGVYLLGISTPETIAANSQIVRHAMVVSHLHITLKYGSTELLAWVTDLNTASPRAGQIVDFYDSAFSKIGSAKTDDRGLAILRGVALQDRGQAGFFAMTGAPGKADFGLVSSDWNSGLNPYEFNLPQQYSVDPFIVYLQTDRPIYRPGQMVYFKGIVRTDDDARYTISPTVRHVNLFLNNDQGQRVLSSTIPLGANGTFTTQFALDTLAPTGSYNAEICAPNPSYDPARVARPYDPRSQPCTIYRPAGFEVAAYRRPEFEASITPAQTDILTGADISATIAANYFFGGNVANAKVAWSVSSKDYVFDRYGGQGRYTFGDFDFYFLRDAGNNTRESNGVGTTDANGKFSFRLPTNIDSRKNSAEYTLEASITDANDQSVSTRATVIVHKGKAIVGVATDSFVIEQGKSIQVSGVMVDWQGAPISDGTAVFTLLHREWFSVQQEDRFGNRLFTSVPSDTVITRKRAACNADGQCATDFRLQDGGTFRITAEDASDIGSAGDESATYVWASSRTEYVGWRIDNNDRIELKLDRTTYMVGDVANLLIPSPFSGTVTALVSIERGRLLQQRVLTLTSNSALIEVPIEASFAPNAYISVVLLKGVDAQNPVAGYKLGMTGFKVNPSQFALHVTVSPERLNYSPRDIAVYDIAVTDATSKPVQAELSLALVDKAILTLVASNNAPLLDLFYGTRAAGIQTADTLNISVDRVTQQVIAEYGKGGGGGRGLADLASDATRGNFQDTAYWNGIIQTDAQGHAQVKIPLPDNLTTWRMEAQALANDSNGWLMVGQAISDVVASKPLLVRPVLPRFFTVGDQVTLGAVINNNTATDLDVHATLDAKGVSLVSTPPATTMVRAHGSGRLNWDLLVQDAPNAILTFSVVSGDLKDSVQLAPASTGGPDQSIPILHYVANETIATTGDLREPGRKVEVVALPRRFEKGQGTLDVQVDTSLTKIINNGLEQLESSPYDDNELVASRLLAGSALNRDATEISRHVQRLQGAQLADGGWGWYAGSTQSNEMVSAHVLLALSRARAKAYAVDANVFNRAGEYLGKRVNTLDVSTPANVANRQAMFAFVLADAGHGNSGRLAGLYEFREKLSYYARALVALGLQMVNPGDTRITTLLADLYGAANLAASGASWHEKSSDPYSFDSDIRTTAMVVDAITKLDAKNALGTNAVRWLLMARSGRAWISPQETTWAILALTDWRAATGDANQMYTWRVSLNNVSVANGTASARDGTVTVQTPISQLLPAVGNELTFERGEGTGVLYYSARLNSVLPADEAKAINRGIVVARKYELAECTPKPGSPCAAINEARVGQNVRVRLTVVAPHSLYFVRLTDPLPAGAESLDPRLVPVHMPEIETRYAWCGCSFEHTQLRDSVTIAEASYLPSGTHELTYLLRPAFAGTYKVMPAQVTQTYLPESFGRSDGAQFKILP